jgi:hypothetical protein
MNRFPKHTSTESPTSHHSLLRARKSEPSSLGGRCGLCSFVLPELCRNLFLARTIVIAAESKIETPAFKNAYDITRISRKPHIFKKSRSMYVSVG